MKILFSPCHYIFTDKSGSELSWSFNIADGLAKYNPDSVVVSGTKDLEDKIKKYKILELQKGKTVIDLSIKNAFIFNIQYYLKTRKLVESGKFDILHHVSPFLINTTFNLFFLLSKNKLPLIIGPIQSPLIYKDNDIDSSNIRKFSNIKKSYFRIDFLLKLINPILLFLSRKTLENAWKIIVINNYTKELLIKDGIDNNKILVIPPGINSKKYRLIDNTIHNSKIKLITTSYLVERKGIDILLKGIAEIKKNNIPVELTIIGDGPQKDSLVELSKELGISQHVKFIGYIPYNEIPLYYSKANIFISMSRDESWGQMYLEAMASGLPIVCSINNGSKSIIIDKKFGYLIEQEDYNELSKKIVELYSDGNKLRSFSKKAREEIEMKYDWEKVIIPKYSTLYKEVINYKLKGRE